ncbi:MAG: hypothetical protein H7Z19_15005 [Chitinophagaceae bacterium]|nr:hypothetical protein [Rubrivivax sp.]
MKIESCARLGLTFALAGALAACGGGGDGAGDNAAPSPSQASAENLGAKRLLATPMAGTQIRPAPPTTSQLLDWAQTQYPTLFESGTQTALGEYQGLTYEYRHYPGTGNYLGVRDGEAYGLGPFTGDQLQGFGKVADYACHVFSVECAGVGIDTLTITGARVDVAGGGGSFKPAGAATATETAASCVTAAGRTTCTSLLAIGWSESTAERLVVTLHSSYADRGVTPGHGVNGINLAYSVFGSNGLSVICLSNPAAGADCDFAALGIRLNPQARTLTFNDTRAPVPGGGTVMLNGTLTY